MSIKKLQLLVILKNPSLIIPDEPENDLDETRIVSLFKFLQVYRDNAITIIVSYDEKNH